ncbi:receptor-type tyrosine-protein phosphatase mu-like isoform X2 [Daphnia pulex]|uniref:receptor-type tyrosine-protein phosphatase mu-like isoform X2 n=1 Tax=Daphnia pulex TaxID=6669 RepID=UPI001EDF00F3|nr:receptor-type tyrosine-protein phosphatase mu-like isoform X2 [Daphnia pulex]
MESSVIIGDQHVNNATTSAAVVAAAQSFLVNQTAGILFFAVQQDQSASANDMVLRTSATINVVPAQQQQHARCCKLTEGVYTIMGCISVTLFFLGVATIKFLGKKYSTPRAARKHRRLLRKYQIAEEGNAMAAIADKPVDVANFVKHCEQRRKYPVLLRVEFQTACKVEGHSTRHGSKPENRPKNQNQKIIPYDYNRVVLDLQPGIPDSDYVNGSYVDSILKPNAYVVTQGPNERTVSDFWRLVWQSNASCIVMLTKTFDFIKVMCVQYWPASKGKVEVYDGITVSYNHEEQLANFVIRNFKITKEGPKGKEERALLQFHYTEWHSHTCPYSNNIVEFRRRVRAALLTTTSITHTTGPMIVHCNDGGGRSGVFMAIDANMELVEEDGLIDIFGYMKKLRQARRGLVETLEQFKFIYDTLEESITCGWSWFPVSELTTRLKQKSIKHPVTKLNEYQKEYAQICKLTPRFTIGDCAGGHRSDNRHKNRDVLIIPPDNFRPYLTSFQGNSFTDYINAVFIDGYTRPREYIVTEWPLPHTLGDLWSLVYDYDCSAVVVLTSPPPSSSYPAFWPDGRRSVKYGPVFTVDHVSHNHYPNIKSWIFRINKKDIAPHRRTLVTIVNETRKMIKHYNRDENQEIVSLTELMAGVKAMPKTCQLFQLMCWPEGHKVPTSTNALVELMNMVERWRQRTDYGPVVVISSDGTSRVGVYFAANACIEQVIQHGEVDVFQAVKNVRRHRPQLVENLTEFKYCYDLVLHYVLHYLHRDGSKK